MAGETRLSIAGAFGPIFGREMLRGLEDDRLHPLR